MITQKFQNVKILYINAPNVKWEKAMDFSRLKFLEKVQLFFKDMTVVDIICYNPSNVSLELSIEFINDFWIK